MATAVQEPASRHGQGMIGCVVGHYRITGRLGGGGMGVVYTAEDLKLGRTVALKFLSPELTRDEEAKERFLIEARATSKLDHSNICNLHEIGETPDGQIYLVMACYEGETLRDRIARGRLDIDETMRVSVQIARGLEAAHSAGIIHRDIKPANIMITSRDEVKILDFGLAKLAGVTVTRAHESMGTAAYMAPEQVRAQPVSPATDLWALGVVMFEMLNGGPPFAGANASAMFYRIENDTPPPLSELRHEVPAQLSDIVTRLLQKDPAKRYRSAAALLADLEGHDKTSRISITPRTSRRKAAIASVVAALAIAAAALFVPPWITRIAKGRSGSTADRKPVSILVADLQNRTDEPIFNGTLEPLLTIALEGAPFITAFDRGQAHKAAEQLRPGITSMDDSVARLVALREGAEVIVGGSVEKASAEYMLEVRAVEAASGRILGQATAKAEKREAVLNAVSKVAVALRKSLGEASPADKAAEETFSAASLEAAQKYARGQTFQWGGKYEEAIAAYSEAAALDPSLGRAYSGMAAMYANLGDREQAEKYYQLALSHLDRMTDREKYRTRGGYYLFTHNHAKALEEFSALSRDYPADTAALNNIAFAHFYRREMDRAASEGRKAVAIVPKNVLYRNNLALYAMYAGHFDEAEKEAREVLKLNPSFAKAYLALAVAAAARDQVQSAEAEYRRMATVGKRGASLSATGLADLALHRGDGEAAMAILPEAIAADEQNGNKNGAAQKRVLLAEAQLAAGKRDAALATAAAALQTSNGDAIRYSAGRVYVAAGSLAKAKEISQQLGQKIEPETQTDALLLEGERLLAENNAREALQTLQAAQRLSDTWMGRFLLARTYRILGAYPEADTEIETAIRRKGEATALLLDDIPTVRLLPLLDYELGCIREGLKSPAAKESFDRFVRARSDAKNDPLVLDARRRSGAA